MSYGTDAAFTLCGVVSSGTQKNRSRIYFSSSALGGNIRTRAVISPVLDKSRPAEQSLPSSEARSISSLPFMNIASGIHCRSRFLLLSIWYVIIHLPSGKSLAYVKPCIGENQFGGESVTYMGIGSTKKWERLESYGSKFVTNIAKPLAGISSAMQCELCHIVLSASMFMMSSS